ncbi:agmatinase [Candidatus Micrarchaeota archaeon]|nr:agmatinase [Candidatus Micrarchaeota archaeon]
MSFLRSDALFEEAEIVVLPVPYDSTVSYISGTRLGPAAIIEASNYLEAYDIELGINICDKLKIHTAEELPVAEKKPEEMVKVVEEAVRKIVKAGKKPVVFGGEHTITAGVVAGLDSPVSVLQIDAHTDLRNSYQGTKYSHGCAMRRVREITDDVVQVGIRSMCDEEADYIKQNGLEKKIHYAYEKLDIKKIVSQLGENVYVSVDVDGFDPSVVPGTGTPEPGGLSWYDVVSLMKAVSKKNVVGFDIVEALPVPPLPISEYTAAKLAYTMMGQFWIKR